MTATASRPRVSPVEACDAELRALLRAYLTGEMDHATWVGLSDRILDRRFAERRDELAARFWRETFES